MCHTSDICVLCMVTSVTWSWPWTELNIKHLLNQCLALYFRSTRGKFWPKTDNFEVSTARNLKAPILNLTWPWPDTWPHLENLGDALGSSHRELSNAASFVSLRPFVRELTRALLGGGAFERPPLRFFEDSEKTAARSAAGFSPTLPPIVSATFVKISTQCHVRSGHQVRSSDPTTK